jgi:hypothetical protein
MTDNRSASDGRRLAGESQRPAPVPVRHFVGLDLGQRSDPSALAVLEDADAFNQDTGTWERSLSVRHLKRWPLGAKYPAIVEDVRSMLASPKLLDPVLIVDETGCGAAVCDLFEQAEVRGTLRRAWITAGHAVKRDEASARWNVPKKALVSILQSLMQRNKLAVANLPERAVLMKELLNFKVKISAAANELFAAWREGEHDDLVLATALACWAAEGTASRLDPDAVPHAFGGRGEPPIYRDRRRGGIDGW